VLSSSLESTFGTGMVHFTPGRSGRPWTHKEVPRKWMPSSRQVDAELSAEYVSLCTHVQLSDACQFQVDWFAECVQYVQKVPADAQSGRQDASDNHAART
jgi:hypothetical protein